MLDQIQIENNDYWFFIICNIVHKSFVREWTINDTFTKISSNDLKNKSSESEQTLSMFVCCTTITHQLMQYLQLENIWQRKTFLYFYYLPKEPPNLVLHNFYLFPKLNSNHFRTVGNMQKTYQGGTLRRSYFRKITSCTAEL